MWLATKQNVETALFKMTVMIWLHAANISASNVTIVPFYFLFMVGIFLVLD